MPGIPMQDIEHALMRAGWPFEMVREYTKARSPVSEAPAALQCVGINKDNLQGIELKVLPGEIFGITGLPDSGVSLLLHVMAGIVQPDEGTVHIALKGPRRPRVGFVPNKPAVIPVFTVRENIDHWLRVTGFGGVTRVNELISFGRLSKVADKRVDSLPYGMQKKVDLVCAITHRPSIVFINEPVEGVDHASRKEIWSLIREIGRKATVVIASHPCAEMESICSHIAILSKGRVAQVGTPDDFIGAAKGRYVVIIELKNHTRALVSRLLKHKAKFVSGRCIVTAKNPLAVVKTAKLFAASKKDIIMRAEIRLPGIQDVLEALVS